MNKPVTIYVRKLSVQGSDGKKFTTYETTDTKDKTRLSVAFVQDGDKAPEKSCKIRATDWWIDKRKRYPKMRIRKYECVDDLSDVEDSSHYDEFFGD